MAPDMAVAHQLADLRGKHAQAALNERKAMHVDAGFMHHGNCAVGKSPKARRGGLAIRPSFLH
jgi:hypothetical protein